MELGTKRLDLEVTSCIQYIGDTVTMNIVSTVYHNEDSYQVFGLIYIYVYMICMYTYISAGPLRATRLRRMIDILQDLLCYDSLLS